MKIRLMNGNVLDMLRNIPDESIDCVVSSPPYYGLRSYKGADAIWAGNPECDHEWVNQEIHKNNLRFRDPNHKASVGNHKNQEIYSSSNVKANSCSKCGAWNGQLGLEPTYQMYIDHLMLIMKELKRVLKKTGTLFWNMGDSYSGSGGAGGDYNPGGIREGQAKYKQGKSEIPSKSLMMIPERLAMGMIDQGWILRNKLIWYKPNGMPSSVRDRFSNKWEYIFFFSKSGKYYFDLDSVRKPLSSESLKNISQKNIPNQFQSEKSVEFGETSQNMSIPKILNNMKTKHDMAVNRNGRYDDPLHTKPYNENGANPGDVIYDSKYMKYDYGQTLQGFTRDNTIEKARKQSYIDAVKLFPDDVKKQKEYIKNIHDHLGHPNGANPGDVISQPAVRHKSLASNPGHDFTHERKYDPDADGSDFLDIPTMPHSFAHFAVFPKTLVEPLIKAGCPPDGIVLDPFAGSGTVGVVAMKQDKNAILIEISSEYCNIIKKRLNWGAGLGVEYESFPRADVMEAPNE